MMFYAFDRENFHEPQSLDIYVNLIRSLIVLVELRKPPCVTVARREISDEEGQGPHRRSLNPDLNPEARTKPPLHFESADPKIVTIQRIFNEF
jgi:hypothetical protein